MFFNINIQNFPAGLLILFLLSFHLRSQDIGHFNQFSINSGLSQSSITAMCLDRNGFLWLGTQDGLNRYNGKENKYFDFTPFDTSGLLGDGITQLLVSESGKILVLSGGGIDEIDPSDFSIRHIIDLKKQLPFRKIYLLWEFDSSLFISTNTGVYKTNVRSGIFRKINHDHSNDKILVKAFIINDSRTVLATDRGLFAMYRGDTVLTFIHKTEKFSDVRSFSSANYAVFFSNGNDIFKATGENFADALQLYSCNSKISALAIDAPGNLWAGTEGDGVVVLKKEQKNGSFRKVNNFKESSTQEYGLKCNYINHILADTLLNPANIWIGTRDAGVFCYSANKNIFRMLSSEIGLPETNFFGIAQDSDGDIWAASNENIYMIDKNYMHWKNIPIKHLVGRAGRPVESICCDSLGNIWMGIGDELYRINKKKYTLESVIRNISGSEKNHVFRIINIPGNRILIGSLYCVTVFDIATGKKENINSVDVDGKAVKTGSAVALFCDSKNNWWFRSPEGLVCYDHNHKKALLFQHNPQDKSSLITNSILDINQLESGAIIIGTTNGLSILNNLSAKTFRNFTKTEGLGNSVIYGILRDSSGNMWMPTNYGIYKFNPSDNSFKGFTSDNGSYINEFNSGGFCKTAEGDIIFGGIGGLVRISPGAERSAKIHLPLFATAFSFDDKILMKTASGASGMKLEYDKNDIYFRFETPSYFDAGAIELKYRIIERDTAWHNIQSDYSLRLVNLSPGTYHLLVNAIDKLDRHLLPPVKISIEVLPPFWKTSWFYALAAGLLLLITFVIYRYNLNKKIKFIRYTEDIRNQENEKVRKAAALDLHDEFGNGLTRISMLIELLKDKTDENNSEVNNLLNLISENSARLYQGTKDFIWSINPANDSLFETAIRIKDHGDEIFSGTGVIFRFSGINEELKQFKYTPSANRNITMIFKEALSNSLKHSGAKNVDLHISITGENCFVTLSDDGKGFDAENKKKGYGLNNMRIRASKINAVLNLNAIQGKGTHLTLTLKK